VQAEQVLADIEAVLAAAGSDRAHVLRVECFLAEASDFPAWNRIWRAWFAAPRPARTTVVSQFAVPGILIELQVTAGLTGIGS
jgi:2-iminobutanoate/2-iminopropanoate deaminase